MRWWENMGGGARERKEEKGVKGRIADANREKVTGTC